MADDKNKIISPDNDEQQNELREENKQEEEEPFIIPDPETKTGFCSAVPVCKECIRKELEKPLLTTFAQVPCNLPKKYEHPHWCNGYGSQMNKQHPLYRTSSSEYGWSPPGIHNIPSIYFPRLQKFSSYLLRSGMYRNYSLNTNLDQNTNFSAGKQCS